MHNAGPNRRSSWYNYCSQWLNILFLLVLRQPRIHFCTARGLAACCRCCGGARCCLTSSNAAEAAQHCRDSTYTTRTRGAAPFLCRRSVERLRWSGVETLPLPQWNDSTSLQWKDSTSGLNPQLRERRERATHAQVRTCFAPPLALTRSRYVCRCLSGRQSGGTPDGAALVAYRGLRPFAVCLLILLLTDCVAMRSRTPC